MAVKNIAVIFAAGTGERMGNPSRPKQFLELRDKPVLAYTLEHFQKHREIDGIVLVTLKDWISYCEKMAADWHIDKLAAVELGGLTSQESIRIGLETARRIYGGDVAVLIHDGVRPLVDEETISKCIRCVREYGSAITVSPQTETVMIEEKDGGPCRIVDRDRCRVARAPQCFYLRDILEAHRRAEADRGYRFIDSASLMEHYGYALHTVEGPLENIKITTALDFQIFKAIMESWESGEYPGLQEEMPHVP